MIEEQEQDYIMASFVRKGLGRGFGKIAGPVGNAVQFLVTHHLRNYNETVQTKKWLENKHAKIVLKVNSEQELFDIEQKLRQ